MNTELPKIDIPEDMIIDTIRSHTTGILSSYTNFPCRLKAQIWVLCTGGQLEASINLTRFTVKKGDFITLLPGTILQIHRIEGDWEVYFMGFSSAFIDSIQISKPVLDILYAIKESPVLTLPSETAPLIKQYFELLMQTDHTHKIKNREFTKHLWYTILYGLGEIYTERKSQASGGAKSEKIAKDFTHLVMEHYGKERNVAFYAQQMGITPAHLSTTVRQVTGKTCLEIISSMVIMDAKSQLKFTDLPIHEIAYSLNFTNMSFFGKYFKRHTGLSPQEYRNK